MKKNYIVIEGPDGCGKTTLILALQKKLLNAKYIKEPYNINIKKEIMFNINMHPLSKHYLYLADRILLHDEIHKHHDIRIPIVSDRSVVSSLVYDGYINRLSMEKVYSDNVGMHYIPSIVFILDTPTFEIMDRLVQRGEFINLMEIRKQKKGYELACEFLKRKKEWEKTLFVKLDTSVDLAENVEIICKLLRNVI